MEAKAQIDNSPIPSVSSNASQSVRATVVITATAGFSVLLTVKDLIFRYLALSEWTSSQVLTVSGIGCLVSTILVSFACSILGDRAAFAVKNSRLQIVRLCTAGLSSFFIARAFQHLHATSVAILSKVYIPLLLLISPLTGVYYSKRQQLFAVLAIFMIAAFAVFARTRDESGLGYIEVTLAVLFVMIEYILLRKAALSETLFWIAFTPAVSCILYGLLGCGWSGLTTFTRLSAGDIILGFVAGASLYLIYAISKYRYRLFSIGISEYPSLAAALLILPAETLLFGWRADLKYAACLFATIGFMALTMYFRDSSPQKKGVLP